jgi:hypothetical protein
VEYADQADDDEVNCHNKVEQARHDQNYSLGDRRNFLSLPAAGRRTGNRIEMMWNRLRDYLSGNVPRRTLISKLIPLIFICYFGTITFGAVVLRETYDWRSSVISYLLSPLHDPEYHWFAAVGLSFAGFLAIPFGGYIRDRLRPTSQLCANIGMAVFVTGTVTLILAATIVTRRTHHVIGKWGVHEIFARASALTLGIGLVCFCWCVLRGFFKDRTNQRAYPAHLVFTWSILTFLPLFAALTCGVCAFIPRAGISWLLPLYELLMHSPLWKLGFWEWIGSIAVFLFLLSAALFLPKRPALPVGRGE